MKQIIERETKYRKLLSSKLNGDKRLSISCPDFTYPAPVFVHIKSVKTEKSIAVRLDGVDKTMRFWDYVDDDYSEEDGVWDEMSEEGLTRFVSKLYEVMQKAVDIEFYSSDGECDDFFSGVAEEEIDEAYALKTIKKLKVPDFAFVRFSDFFGEKQYVFDKNYKRVVRK